MKSLTIDKTRLLTVTNYAKRESISRQAVHYQIKKGLLEKIEIDGVVFVKVK